MSLELSGARNIHKNYIKQLGLTLIKYTFKVNDKLEPNWTLARKPLRTLLSLKLMKLWRGNFESVDDNSELRGESVINSSYKQDGTPLACVVERGNGGYLPPNRPLCVEHANCEVGPWWWTNTQGVTKVLS